MTPEQKLDSVTQLLGLLKTLCEINFLPSHNSLFMEEYSLLSPEEIARNNYRLNLDRHQAGRLNSLVVDGWRKKYGYPTHIKPCRDDANTTYLYYSFDWDIVKDAVEKMGYCTRGY
jgi:hypothetical protein